MTLDDLPKRMSAAQYVASEVGGKAETICALLEENGILRAMVAERDARIAELEKPK